MLYAVFDIFHALVNPIRQDILRGGAENRRFCDFLTLGFEFLTTYEVSRPLHRRKFFIASRSFDSLLFGYRKLPLQVEVCNKNRTVYTKRSPSYQDYLDKFFLRNSLN